MMEKESLVGKIFGKLTVIERIGRKYEGNKNIYWKCRCSCGREIDVRRSHLTCTGIKSCGCLSGIKPNGIKKNKLFSVIETICKCECFCGNVFFADDKHIKSGFVESCGCLRKARSYALMVAKKQKLKTNDLPKDFIDTMSVKYLIDNKIRMIKNGKH
jgi:hypothetical protein